MTLRNPSFDGDWTRDTHTGQAYGEIFVPEGWTAYWREGLPVPWDPGNDKGFARPEIHVINFEPPFLDPPRVRNGTGRSLKLFSFFRVHDGGIYQRVGVSPGSRVRLGAYAHAWYSQLDTASRSQYQKGDQVITLRNGDPGMGFRVGVDPTGGTDPWHDRVVWGPEAHLYDAYAEVPSVTVAAQASAVTLFLRSTALYPFKHCDAYWDDAWLEVTQGDEPTQPPPTIGGSYAYPVIAQGSKLGHHTLDFAELEDALIQAPVCTVKAIDAGCLCEVKELAPHTLTVGRFMEGVDRSINVEGPSLTGDLKVEAQRVMGNLLPRWEPVRDCVDWWEVINEQDPEGVDGHRRLAEFTHHCLDIADAEGYKLAILSYPVGVPEYAEFAAVVETGLFAKAKAGGHALALHEYAWPIDQSWGEPLPGLSAYPNRGPFSCRYRWWYEDFLKPRDEVVPLLITEFNLALGQAGLAQVDAETWLQALRWYDARLREDYYVLGAHLFTMTEVPAWEEYDYWERFGTHLVTYLNAERDKPNALPDDAPLEQYDRTVIIADPTYLDAAGLVDAYLLGREKLQTVSPSWNDAVPEAQDRPAEWRTNTVLAPGLPVALQSAYTAYVRERDPGTVLKFPVAHPETHLVIPYKQCHPDWGTLRLGASNHTLCSAGCLVTAIASAWSVDHPDVTPADYAAWLNAHGGFLSDGRLVLAKPAEMVGDRVLVDYLKWREPGQEADLARVREALKQGPTIVQVDLKPATTELDSHFVVLVADLGDDFRMMDPLTGEFGSLMAAYGRGSLARSIFALLDYRRQTPPPSGGATPPLLGFNDPNNQGAGQWLVANGLRGLLVIPTFLGTTAQTLDYTAFANAGIRVLVNLRYSWSTDMGGAGTLPQPYTAPGNEFVAAAIATIRNSRGVWGWEIGNEANNPREWPRGETLTASGVARLYNQIWNGVRESDLLSPGALDPFNAQAGDPRDWLATIYGSIAGADFLSFHGYSRGPDPAQIGSLDRFADAPLQWQYLNYPGCVAALWKALPSAYQGKPVYVTEYNHLYKDQEPNWGWVTDERAARVVQRAYAAAQEANLAGVALYRWTGDAWAVHDNAAVLGAVRDLLG